MVQGIVLFVQYPIRFASFSAFNLGHLPTICSTIMVDNMNHFELSPPLDLSYHFSDVTRNREASKIKQFYKYFQIPGIGNLAGGLPHPSYFPFDTLESKSALPNRWKPTPNNPVHSPPSSSKPRDQLNDPSSTRVIVPHESREPNPLQRIDLNTALQYGTAQGYPPLYAFVREFALTKLHPNIPYKNGAEVILTCGSTDGFAKTIECFTNPWTPNSGRPLSDRQSMLCEEFAYMNAIQTARPRGLNIVPVAIDSEGMLAYGHPKSLYNVLSNWEPERDGGRRPHIMYTVTMGQNPTSGLLSVKRRKEIYELCQKFDVLIVEDDPYFYIQFPHAANELTQKHRNGQLASLNHFMESNLNYQTSLAVPVRGTATSNNGNMCATTRMKRGKSSGSEFLDSLVPSYLSFDVDGRVIRLDTFSKTIAPGCRLGWLTAQPAIVERILRITETTTQQPSGFVQSLVAELLIGPDDTDQKMAKKGNEQAASGWKMDGWIRWLEGLRGNYERRMRTMCEVLEEGKFIMSSKPPPSPTASKARTTTLPIRIQRRRRLDPIISACSHSRANRSPPFSIPSTPVPRAPAPASDLEPEDFEVLHKTQIYDFTPPMAGMFAWIRFNFETHPVQSFPLPQLAHAFWIFQTKKPYLVLTAPGPIFAPSEQIREEKAWQYFRLCYAAIDEKDVKDMSERFVRAGRDFWELNEEHIRELLDEDNEGVDHVAEAVKEMEGKWTVSPLMC